MARSSWKKHAGLQEKVLKVLAFDGKPTTPNGLKRTIRHYFNEEISWPLAKRVLEELASKGRVESLTRGNENKVRVFWINGVIRQRNINTE